MKLKIKLLISLSALVLMALMAVQYYLVQSAYHYQVNSFRSEVKEKIAQVTDNYATLDTGIFVKKDQLYKELAAGFIADKRVRTSISEMLRENAGKNVLTQKISDDLKRQLPDLNLHFAVLLNRVIVLDNSKPADTIYSGQADLENALFGNLKSLDNAFVIRNYVGTTSPSAGSSDLSFITEDSLYISVADSEMIILKRMAAILIFSLLSIITLVTLFIITIRSLITQKKISDIKTDFINNITHELKTPLTTLAVSTQLLRRTDIRENEKVVNDVLNTISRQNIRLQQLIDQVMNNALGSREIALRQELVPVNRLLSEIITDFERGLQNIMIGTQLDDTDTKINVDKFLFTTAVINVLENAVKYGCTNIILSARRHDGQMHISIKDNGIGIAKSKQPLLFDKFYRIKEGNLHNTKGLGLGLYYVEQIVRAHSGRVGVDSEPGHGANFTFILPLA